MKLISEHKALDRLRAIKDAFRQAVSEGYERRAKDCLTCETQGECCLDAHFVNVHISRLEAAAINRTISSLPAVRAHAVLERIDRAVEDYGLTGEGDSYAKTFACPLFEKGSGCMVHETGKPLPCIAHACYENAADLPPDALLAAREREVDELNTRVYRVRRPWLPLPLALQKTR